MWWKDEIVRDARAFSQGVACLIGLGCCDKHFTFADLVTKNIQEVSEMHRFYDNKLTHKLFLSNLQVLLRGRHDVDYLEITRSVLGFSVK